MSDAAVETTQAAVKVEEPATTTTTTNESKDTISTADSTSEKFDSADTTQQQQKQETSNKVESSSSSSDTSSNSSKENKDMKSNDSNDKITSSCTEEVDRRPSETIESITSNKVDGAKVDRSPIASEESKVAESKSAPEENSTTELKDVTEDGKATEYTSTQDQSKQRTTNNLQTANGDSDKAANGTDSTTDDKSNIKKERKGILSDASVLPPSEDPAEIKKQVEFYFSDANLRFDKFLYSLVTDQNRWVGLDIVCSFNRMKRFKAEAVPAALEDSELLELDEKKENIRRRVGLKQAVATVDNKVVDRAVPRSIYMRGFGKETRTSQFDIEKYFESTGIAINAVRLRRDDSKVFKGSVFVEFKQTSGLELWKNLAEKPQWEGKTPTLLTHEEEKDDRNKVSTTEEKAAEDAEEGLKWMTKGDFIEMKKADIAAGKIKPNEASRFKKQQKFDALSNGQRNNDRHSKDHRGGRPDLRNDKWKRGENVDDDRRDNRDRRDRDRRGGGGRGGRDHRGGRGGRGGHRDRNDRNDRNRNDRRGDRDRKGSGSASPGPRVDENGIPIVKVLSRSPSPRRAPRQSHHLENQEKSNIKREREDDNSGAASPKKSKIEEEVKVEKRQREEGHDDAPSPKKVKAESD